jgi:hypothetical protein
MHGKGQVAQISAAASAPAPMLTAPMLSAGAALVPAHAKCPGPDLAPVLPLVQVLNIVKMPVLRRVKIPSFDLDISSEEESDYESSHAVEQPQPQEGKSALPQPQHQPQQHQLVQILPAPRRQERPSQTTPSQALAERQYQQQPGGEKTDCRQQSSASFVRQQEGKTQARSKIPSFDLQVSSDSEEERNDDQETSAKVRDFEQCDDGKQRARVYEGLQSVSLPLSTHAEANAVVPILNATAKAHASRSQGGRFSQGDAIISLSPPPIFGAVIFIPAVYLHFV